MKLSQPGRLFFGFSWAVALTVLIIAAKSVSDDKKAKPDQEKQYERLIYSLKGPDLYRAHCAPCHGTGGKGDGPVAPALNSRLPDLTTIAQRNGGNFPTARVRSIITGDQNIAAHGSREMPVWGPIFHQIEEDRDYGDIRLQNLTEYLQSMQQK